MSADDEVVAVRARDLLPGMVLADRPGLPLRSVWLTGPGYPWWASASTIIAKVVDRVPVDDLVTVLASSVPKASR